MGDIHSRSSGRWGSGRRDRDHAGWTCLVSWDQGLL